MVAKIFEILGGIKTQSNITKSTQVEAVEKIVDEIMNGNINPVEAYVVLDFLKKVTDEAAKEIKATTIEYIDKEGDNIAFNVQLSLQKRLDYHYEEDKMYADNARTLSIIKDGMDSRAKFLRKLVQENIEAGKETPISYTTSISIIPKPQSNT
jgi:hypothetical protein